MATKSSDLKSKRKAKTVQRTYKTRKYLRVLITVGMAVMLFISVVGALSGIYYLITLHIEEIVMISEIKN